jgi:flagellar biosynthesis/type III secretory pathway protein FliH
MIERYNIKLTKAQQKELDAYKQGRKDGYKAGFKAGQKSINKKEDIAR